MSIHRFNVQQHTTLEGKTIDVFPKCHMYIHELEQRIKNQKEVIDKIYELIKQHIRKDEFLELNEWQTRDLLDLLKEVSK